MCVANKTWEIPSYNTMMLLEKPLTVFEHPFEDTVHCILFNPEIKKDVYEKSLYWLGEENERRKIAKAGHEHLKKYHTCKARANELLEVAKERDIIQ
jgi:spore maturation protein CgeB